MNTLHKLLFASFIVLGIAFIFQCYDVEAASRYSSKVLVEAPSSSGAISGFTKGCAVTAVYASSNTVYNHTNWFVLLATNVTIENISIDNFANSQYRSPALWFPVMSTVAAINANQYTPQVYKVFDYGEEGISFSTAPYIYKTAATSGQAQRVWLEIIP